MSQRQYWENVYLAKPPDKVGWYKPHLDTSLRWIKTLALAQEANIIDVGGGASTLVDDLLAEGYRTITVVDLSKTALALARKRLRDSAKAVTWLEGDITAIDLPPSAYDLWHDRAVFHFLTSPAQRQQYLDNLLNALKPGGHFIIATFSLEAPPNCSGLAVERYSATKLERLMGPEFLLRRSEKELHITPSGVEQMYLYCHFRRKA